MTATRARVDWVRSDWRPGLVLLLAILVLLVLVPATVVLPGPLKSNGSPSTMLTFGALGLLVVGYSTGLPGPRLTSGGILILLCAAALQLVTWAHGQSFLLTLDERAATTRAAIRVILYVSLTVTVLWCARTRGQRFLVVVTLVGLLSYSAIIGILQARAGVDGRYWLRPPGFVLNRDFDFRQRAGFSRAFGTADSPIEFSVLMSCLLALSILVVRNGSSRWVRLLGVVGLILAPIGLLDSLSRTGVVTVAGVFIVYALSLPLLAMGVALVGVALVLTVLFVLDPSRFSEVSNLFFNASTDNSVTGRTDDYATVAEVFNARPILGLGLGRQAPGGDGFLDNEWLQLTVQGGLVGILAGVLHFGGAALATLGRYRDRAHKNECVAYLAVVVALLISSFTFDLFAFQQARLLLFIAFGLAWSARRDLALGRRDSQVRQASNHSANAVS